MSNTHPKSRRTRRLRPTPALVVAFVALFAAMGGFGYAAVKVKPNSVRSKNIRAGAVTTDKIADGAVTTPKLAPDAVAPNAVYAMNAAKLGGVAPGGCQTGWLKASLVVDTDVVDAGTADGHRSWLQLRQQGRGRGADRENRRRAVCRQLRRQ